MNNSPADVLTQFYQYITFHIPKSSNPAPLELCSSQQFDLSSDTILCPVQRNALRDFYYSTKGGEWTDSTNWTDPYISHCFWRGVSCTNDVVTELDLANNGLSGKLTLRQVNCTDCRKTLSSLEVLDLSDNDIKVSLITAFHAVTTILQSLSLMI